MEPTRVPHDDLRREVRRPEAVHIIRGEAVNGAVGTDLEPVVERVSFRQGGTSGEDVLCRVEREEFRRAAAGHGAIDFPVGSRDQRVEGLHGTVGSSLPHFLFRAVIPEEEHGLFDLRLGPGTP